MSKIEVNQIASQIGGVLTIGASGDTVTLAAGASQSGFGRSGSVNWDTTKKTANFTAVSGNGYFVDTNTTAITVTLPATPAAGDIVAIADYANTAATNNITVGRNSSPIDGSAVDGKISINGQVYTLVYVDATEGWKTVGQTFNQITTAQFVAATGGTITTCGDYKIHSFTGPGTFTISCAGNPLGSTTVDYMVVAGGASGGNAKQYGCTAAGGGGAGGYRESYPNPATGGFPVTATAYPITVGGGGAANTSPAPVGGTGNNGNPSIFSTITSTGGGGGGGAPGPAGNGLNGGSGGGSTCSFSAGTGNTPPTSPSQGNPGGTYIYGGGGGGAGGAGNTTPGVGGNGTASTISGSSVTRAGGGGAGGAGPNAPRGTGPAAGGPGGGGPGGGPSGTTASGTAGTTNTGSGGGGGSTNDCSNSGAGGSGIVVIRYKFQ